MFAKIVALFALVAVAFAAPNPKPEPQFLAYSSGLDYVSPYVPSVVSPYVASPVVSPYAYSAYPAAAAVYLRR